MPIVLDQARILYDWFGAYPSIPSDTSSSRVRFGGIPQRVVNDDSLWSLHQQRIREFVNRSTPTIGIDSAWTGYAIIDYEHWSPLWSHTPKRYRKASISLERSRMPSAPQDSIQVRARRNYEAAARTFLVRTLEYANQVRPNAQWGYYGYPHPGRVRSKQELSSMQATNNRLQWLYDAAEVIYPTIYMLRRSVTKSPGRGEAEVETNCAYVHHTLEEAVRVADGKPVVPFTWHYYHSTNPQYADTLLTGYDLKLQYVYPAFFRVDAILMWGSARLHDDAFRAFLRKRVAPMIEYAQNLSSRSTATDHRLYLPSPCWSNR